MSNTDDNEYWAVNSGDIKDDGGLLVTSEFRKDNAEAMAGPLQFDFKAPSAAAIHVNKAPVPGLGDGSGPPAQPPLYSHDAVNAITLAGAADKGVGLAPQGSYRIDVGDCAANSPFGPGSPSGVDRTKVGFTALYEVSSTSTSCRRMTPCDTTSTPRRQTGAGSTATSPNSPC